MMKYIFLAVLVFSLGCVSNEINEGLVIQLTPDPPLVLENGVAKIHVDVTNSDIKGLDGVKIEIFNYGIMPYENEELCLQSGDFKYMLPGEFRTFSCNFRAPRINQQRVANTFDVKASFAARFSAVQQLELLSYQEYNNRISSSGISYKPQSYSYYDRNIELRVDFSDTLPIVVRPEKEAFVKFTIRNIGNGFIHELNAEDVQIIQKGTLTDNVKESDILQSDKVIDNQVINEPCKLQQTLSPIGKEFPSFSCRIAMPSNVDAISNFNFIVNINYQYEIREKTSIDIIK